MSAFSLHDDWPTWQKVAIVAALLVPVMAWVVFGDGSYFPLFLAYGLGVCALGGYWLGGLTWLLVPLLAMGTFLALAIPMAWRGQLGDETAFSMLLESPFWAGLPALVGSLVGVALRWLSEGRSLAAGRRAG